MGSERGVLCRGGTMAEDQGEKVGCVAAKICGRKGSREDGEAKQGGDVGGRCVIQVQQDVSEGLDGVGVGEGCGVATGEAQ
jgi:hypothetical protein